MTTIGRDQDNPRRRSLADDTLRLILLWLAEEKGAQPGSLADVTFEEIVAKLPAHGGERMPDWAILDAIDRAVAVGHMTPFPRPGAYYWGS